MKRVSVAVLFLALSFGVSAGEVVAPGFIPAPVSLDFLGVPLVAFASASYKGLMHRDFVISPDLVGMDKRVTISVKSLPAAELPAFVDALLLAHGVTSTRRGEIYYLDAVPSVPLASAPSVVAGVPLSSSALVDSRAVATGHPVDLHHSDALAGPVVVYAPVNRGSEFLASVVNSAMGSPVVRVAGSSLVYSLSALPAKSVVSLLAALDVPARSVELQASFVEVARTSASGRGVSLVASVLGGKFGVSLGSVGSSLTVNTRGFQAVIDALDSDGRFKQVSNSRLLGDEGEHLLLTVGDETPTVSSAGKDNQGNAVQNIIYKPSGVILDAVARPLGSGRVALVFDGQVSNFVTTVNGVAGSPTLIKRQVKTSVTVGDGEVVVIGGLDDSTSQGSNSGLSFLPKSWSINSGSDKKTDLVLILSASVVKSAKLP